MMKKFPVGLMLSLPFIYSVCVAEPTAFYTQKDFTTINKVDTHVHINSGAFALVELAQELGFKLITINVDYPDFPPVEKQFQLSLDLQARAPQTLAYAGTFLMDTWNEPLWKQKTIEQIKRVRSQGALAIKVWKNVGMDVRNSDGELVMVDDAKLAGIFDFMQSQHIPLIGHQAEPKNCWLPVSEMTTLNDKAYFTHHPQYHMYKHPEMPSYEEQMQHRNAMLEAHPSLQFIGAHVASLEWSVDRLAAFLDRFPNATVDLAARMGQIQYQSQKDYQKVRDFFIKYSSRILYATDFTQSPKQTAEEVKQQAKAIWLSDWQYLTSDQIMSSAVVDGKFKGLHLPKNVIDNIYYQNAIRVFPSLSSNVAN